MNEGVPVTVRQPQVFSASESSPMVVSSTSFVEILRLSSDLHTEHQVTWEVETDRPCDLCLYDESEHVYMTTSMSTPPGCSIGVHGGEASVYGREFRVMMRSPDGMPVNVYRREIRAVRMGEEHMTMTVLKSRRPQPPFDTAIELLEASEKKMELGMFGDGIPLGRTTSLFGRSGV